MKQWENYIALSNISMIFIFMIEINRHEGLSSRGGGGGVECLLSIVDAMDFVTNN